MTKSYLQISLKIDNADREIAAGVYNKYKVPFLNDIKGAVSKEILIRDEDVQVLHGFYSAEDAKAYLSTELFNNNVVTALKPFLKEKPDVRIYTVA